MATTAIATSRCGSSTDPGRTTERRDFIRNATGATGAMTSAFWSRVLGANDRIGLALTGGGGRGEHVMKSGRLDPSVEVFAF